MNKMLKRLKIHKESKARIHKELRSQEYVGAGIIINIRVGVNGKTIHAEIIDPDIIIDILDNTKRGIENAIEFETATLAAFCKEVTDELDSKFHKIKL